MYIPPQRFHLRGLCNLNSEDAANFHNHHALPVSAINLFFTAVKSKGRVEKESRIKPFQQHSVLRGITLLNFLDVWQRYCSYWSVPEMVNRLKTEGNDKTKPPVSVAFTV
jgi:hypothetical protein